MAAGRRVQWSSPPSFSVVHATGSWVERSELDDFNSFDGRVAAIWWSSAVADATRGVRVGSFDRSHVLEDAAARGVEPLSVIARDGVDTLVFLAGGQPADPTTSGRARSEAADADNWTRTTLSLDTISVEGRLWTFGNGWTAVVDIDPYLSVVGLGIAPSEVHLSSTPPPGFDPTVPLDRDDPARQHRDWQATALRRSTTGPVLTPEE